MKKVYLFIILLVFGGFILMALGKNFIWNGIYAPKYQGMVEEKLFFVEEGRGVEEIAIKLEDEGLIRHQLFFKFYVLIRGISDELQTGVYLLSPSMSVSEIANKIAVGDVYTKKITIPEGFTIRQIENRFSETFNREMNFAQFRTADFQDEFNFLKDVPEDRGLEGFLFPDTYQFDYLVTEEEVAMAMLRNFDRKLTTEMRQEIERQDKTFFKIITMASIIEKEVRTLEDKKMVSDILWRRIGADMPLQADATIAYFLEQQGLMPEQGWTFQEMRREIGLAIKIDSPYNTYLRKGLPIGPISNPGINSLYAAINPKSNSYWFYLSTPEGKTIFSKTYQKHKTAINKYLNN
jgi:UPF0755 protein